MRLHFGKTAQPRTGARSDLRQQRFSAYFPRVFAFACAATGNDEAARDVTVAAFTSAFTMPDMREAEFEMELFRSARELCSNGEYRVRRHNDGLSPRERDVISLVFDGQLGQQQVADLLEMRPDAVAMALKRGLRKLQTNLALEPAGGAAMPSFG